MTLISNVSLLSDLVMILPKPPMAQGENVEGIHTHVKGVRQKGETTFLDVESGNVPIDDFVERFYEGAQLPEIEMVHLGSTYERKPKHPMYMWNYGRIIREDVFALMRNALEISCQIFPCQYVTNSQLPKSDLPYRYAHITHRYFFGQAIDLDLLGEVKPGLWRFQTDVFQRGDLEYEGLDLFATDLELLPDIFFAGNYSNLGYPVVKRKSLSILASCIGEFEVRDLPTEDDCDRDIRITENF